MRGHRTSTGTSVVMLALTLLVVSSTPARSVGRPTVELVTGQIVGDLGPRPPGYGFGIELHSGLSVPGPDIGSADVGMRAGAAVLWRQSQSVALGVDASLHSWLMSDQFKETFDQDLRRALLQVLKLGDGPWRMSGRSVTGFVRATLPLRGRVQPWLEGGGGFYWVDPRLQGFTGDGGLFYVTLPDPKPVSVNGICGGAGVDLVTGRHLKVGLGVHLDYLFGKQEMGRDLRAASAALTLGWVQK